MKLLKTLAWLLLEFILLLAIAWACGALYFDWPSPMLAGFLAGVMLMVLVLVRSRPVKGFIFAGTFTLILAWWLTLKPTNNADWQPDVAQLASADINGDVVTLHNVRNCDYRTDTDYTPHWETRTVRLSQITGVDLAIDYWGVNWMAHPIMSFQFAGAPPLCFSIETRRKGGQVYSALGGLYRQFELIYLVSDERDVIRLRTNFRHEDIYLYRLKSTPEMARASFLEYIRTLNVLHDHPRWYNAVTDNCTTAIRHQRAVSERMPLDWRMLINGYGDQMLYERGEIDTSLPFAELKRRSLIDDRAKAADHAPDFSALIRVGLPGMSTIASAH
jgi:hypothetical protein